MSDKFFLDTNVVVYAFDHSSPAKLKIARRLIAQEAERKRAVVSYQVVQEFVNVAMRRFESSMSQSEMEEFLFEALFPMTEVPSSPALVIEALRLRGLHQLAWHDSLILAAAIQARCAVLYSEDFQHGRRFGDLVVENPFL